MIPMNTPPELRQFERQNARARSITFHDASEFLKRHEASLVRQHTTGKWFFGFPVGKTLPPLWPQDGFSGDSPEEAFLKAMEFLGTDTKA